jgi:hypothetical protein
VATQHYKPPRPGLFKLHATLLCVKLDHDTWRMVPLPPPPQRLACIRPS